jgi:hypothetical protein
MVRWYGKPLPVDCGGSNDTMKIVRVYTGADGKSHFEDVEVEIPKRGAFGSISAMVPARGVLFREVDGDYDLDFHNAPRRQYVVNLTGSVDLEVGDGTRRRLGRAVFCSRKIQPVRVTRVAPSPANRVPACSSLWRSFGTNEFLRGHHA